MTYRTDKAMMGYVPVYRQIARDLLRPGGDPPKVLEIGIGDGAGIEMFRDIFGEEVYGIDSDKGRADQGQARWPRHHILWMSQQAIELPEAWPWPWDLIADDASHRPEETSTTLHNMWPRVRAGGYYVIEDWNYFDGEGMASVLWQPILGDMIDWSGVRRYSEAFTDVDHVFIRRGMIVIRKADGELIPPKPPTGWDGRLA